MQAPLSIFKISFTIGLVKWDLPRGVFLQAPSRPGSEPLGLGRDFYRARTRSADQALA